MHILAYPRRNCQGLFLKGDNIVKQKYATRKAAREIIRQEADQRNTNYFSGELKFAYMRDMLRYRMGFGEAETEFILAALVNAGAKFAL